MRPEGLATGPLSAYGGLLWTGGCLRFLLPTALQVGPKPFPAKRGSRTSLRCNRRGAWLPGATSAGLGPKLPRGVAEGIPTEVSKLSSVSRLSPRSRVSPVGSHSRRRECRLRRARRTGPLCSESFRSERINTISQRLGDAKHYFRYFSTVSVDNAVHKIDLADAPQDAASCRSEPGSEGAQDPMSRQAHLLGDDAQPAFPLRRRGALPGDNRRMP